LLHKLNLDDHGWDTEPAGIQSRLGYRGIQSRLGYRADWDTEPARIQSQLGYRAG